MVAEAMHVLRASICHNARTAAKAGSRLMVDRNGRDAEIRTRDLTHPKRARYQAAPRPVNDSKYRRKRLIVNPLRSCSRGSAFLLGNQLGRSPRREVKLTRSLLFAYAFSFLLEEREQLSQLCCNPLQRLALRSGSVTS